SLDSCTQSSAHRQSIDATDVSEYQEISYDAERSAGLHNNRHSRARGSGRGTNAMPGTGATAQRGHRGLETGDESTAIGALRSVISCLLSRGGDTQVRR